MLILLTMWIFWSISVFNHFRQTARIKSDCNGNWTDNDLVRKWTLCYLSKVVKWLSCFVSTYLYMHWLCTFIMSHKRLQWIWSLGMCVTQSCTRKWNIQISTHNATQSFSQIAKWLNAGSGTRRFRAWFPLQSLKFQILRLFQGRSSLTFRQLQSVDSL